MFVGSLVREERWLHLALAECERERSGALRCAALCCERSPDSRGAAHAAIAALKRLQDALKIFKDL